MKLDDYQLGLLTGVLESRGSYYISKHKDYYRPSIQISTQHLIILQPITKRINIPIRSWRDRRDRRRLYYYININGLYNIRDITAQLSNHLIYKKYVNDLMHEFCVSRLSHKKRRYWKGKYYPYKVPYTNRELQIIEIIRSLTNINKSRRWKK